MAIFVSGAGMSNVKIVRYGERALLVSNEEPIGGVEIGSLGQTISRVKRVIYTKFAEGGESRMWISRNEADSEYVKAMESAMFDNVEFWHSIRVSHK